MIVETQTQAIISIQNILLAIIVIGLSVFLILGTVKTIMEIRREGEK